MTTTAMVLAAGLGTRLKPHTDSIAKPALPVMNVPMLAYSWFYLEQAGVNHVVVNTHHEPGSIRMCVKQITQNGIRADFSHESPEILLSGGGLKQAEALIGKTTNDFFLVNGDTVAVFADADILKKAAAAHRSDSKRLATLVLCEHPGVPETFGGVWCQGEAVRGFGKKPPSVNTALKPFHFTGCMILSKRVWDYLPAVRPINILYETLTSAIQDGASVVGCFAEDVLWLETGNEPEYLQAHRKLFELLKEPENKKQQTFQRILNRFTPGWNGLMPGPGQYLHPSLQTKVLSANWPEYSLIGEGASLHPQASFSKNGFVVLGSMCEVREPVLLEDVVVVPGGTVSAKGHLTRALISERGLQQ